MAFIEGVGRKAGHFIVDLVGDLFRNAVGHAARAFMPRLGASMDKMLPLCLHHIMLLFAHGPTDIVCLTEGEASQFPENLHDLFLVDNAPVVTSRIWAS